MRPVRTDRKLKLKQQLVRRRRNRRCGLVSGAAVLRPDLAELARPIGDGEGPARIGEGRVGRVCRAFETEAGEPPSAHLIVAGDVEPRSTLQPVRLVATAPDK